MNDARHSFARVYRVVEPIFRIQLALHPSSRPNGTRKSKPITKIIDVFKGWIGLKRGIDTLSRGSQITKHARWPFSSRRWELRSPRFVRFKLSGASRSDAKFRRPVRFCERFDAVRLPHAAQCHLIFFPFSPASSKHWVSICIYWIISA